MNYEASMGAVDQVRLCFGAETKLFMLMPECNIPPWPLPAIASPLWYWPRLIYHNIYNSSRDFNIPDSPTPRRHNRLWPTTMLFWILKLPSCGFRQHGSTSAVPSLPCRIRISLSFPRCSLNHQLPKLPMLLSSLVLYSLFFNQPHLPFDVFYIL